jgi:hypothetical protein
LPLACSNDHPEPFHAPPHRGGLYGRRLSVAGRRRGPVDGDSGSNPNDDDAVGILEGTIDNPTRQELAAALSERRGI